MPIGAQAHLAPEAGSFDELVACWQSGDEPADRALLCWLPLT